MNSVPQTTATTFAFSFVFILLLWSGALLLPDLCWQEFEPPDEG